MVLFYYLFILFCVIDVRFTSLFDVLLFILCLLIVGGFWWVLSLILVFCFCMFCVLRCVCVVCWCCGVVAIAVYLFFVCFTVGFKGLCWFCCSDLASCFACV